MYAPRRTYPAATSTPLSGILLITVRLVGTVEMSRVEILKGVSLSELSHRIPAQVGAPDQASHPRTQILILIQRRHRQRFEGHTASMTLSHPSWSIFYRPRAEAEEISESGFDPKSASFLFLDVALADLGKWVGPLVKDDWVKEEVIITPSEDADEFPTTKWTCFRDPWLSRVEVLPLAKSPMEFQAKAWVTYPSVTHELSPITTAVTQVTDAQPQADAPPLFESNPSDSEFSGMLSELTHSFGAGIAASAGAVEGSESEVKIPTFSEAEPREGEATPAEAQPVQTFVMPSGPVTIPNLSGGFSPPEGEGVSTASPPPSLSPQPVEPPEKTIPVEEEIAEQTIAEVEDVAEEPAPPLSPETEDEDGQDLEKELLELIELLKAGGLDAEQILESPAFREVSERATVAGVDAWAIFVANAS